MAVRRYFAKALVSATAARRRMRGPLRDAWSLEIEAWSRLMHHYGKRSTMLPLGWQRRALERFVRRPPAHVEVHDVEVDGVPCRWFRPRGADPDRLLVYLHGGGYSIGSVDTHTAWIATLASRAGVTAFAVDYRLAPEHPYPAQLEDSRRAWAHLLEIGVDPARAVIAGESAGGGLTMSTLVALRDAGEPLPAAAAVLSPWVDMTLRGASIDGNAVYDYVHRRTLDVYARRFVGDVSRAHPLVSPVNADLAGLPPLLVQVGGAEALLDDSLLLAERARAAGVDVTLTSYDDMMHAFMLFPGLPHAKPAVDELVRFIERHTAPG